MTEAIFIKRLGSLRPTDAQSQELLDKIKPNAQVRVEVKRLRNPKQHRLYWSLMGLLAEHAEHPCTQSDVSDWIKIAVGHSYVAHYPDGTSEVKPKSIAFGNLPQDEFEEFFRKVIDFACQKIMVGTSNEDLRAELEEMIAPRAA